MKLFSQCSLFFLICCPLPIFAEYNLVGEGPVRITKIEIEAGVKVDPTYFNQHGGIGVSESLTKVMIAFSGKTSAK